MNVDRLDTIEIGGEEYRPIPYGEAEFDETYEERLSRLEEEIEAGGRGRLTVGDICNERDQFLESYPDKQSHQERTCHDCGVSIGETHRLGCDWEECPACGDQYFICACVTDEKIRLWGEL